MLPLAKGIYCTNRPFGKLDLVGGKWQPRVITMQSKRTFIAAIVVIKVRLTIFLEIMKALNEEMTIKKKESGPGEL